MPNSEVSGQPVVTHTGVDELLVCLQILARTHGEAATRDALMAGLPAEHARLTPSLFARAALRAHLSSQLVQTPLAQLNDALLPAVALLQDGKACVVLGFNEARDEVQVIYPELNEATVTVPLVTLEASYIGTAIYARPTQRYDARTPQVRAGKHQHWFWGVIAESRPLYNDVLLAALLANTFALGMPLFVMNVYDRVVPNQAFETLWVLALGLMIMLISDLVLRTMRGRFVDLASSRADVKLSAFIMERVLGTRMEQRPVSAGSFASNLRAFESVRDFIGSATVVAFIDLPFALIFMLVIGWISWYMLIPLIIGAIVMVLYALIVQGRMHELAETTYRAGAQRNATLIEGLVGFETIKALAAEAPIQRKWEKSAALLARVGAQLRLLSSTASNTSAFVQQFINLTIIIIGVYLISERELTMGGLIACTMLASRAMAPVGQVAGLLVQYHTAATALTSLNEMMAREVERPADTTFISRGRLKGEVEFRDVSFSYPGQTTPSLRNLSFKLKPGEKVAILGRIGSGKTTLEKLILGLYQPTEGAVLVDGIDLRQLDPAELRRQIGYVQQDVMLFYGSLRENITLGAPLADDADIVKAAEIGGILSLVNQHPKGFDMLVGERGESLSGGQRQGVAIARAVINDPPIMLLDEPTSSMDFSSEDDIKRRLTEFSKDKTVILISHRTSLLDLADRIIVMDGGRIMADGPKEQVITALRQGRIGKAA
ncbi:type I secretion system permease/ATPase [Rhodoferax sp.]|uniref:type I secretion system permease/ATPase n=1 Tax=Rhodoferax sp. TaxID=50421 RepID=UPI00273144B6|nr:type I secretion system permease/ATPase [Rhodoferax sp.]MDP1531462.1 type I secretion system permease/ATPase [Rhodoferax sp.]MDP1944126.1 type I secretion system permease/ATPase [Rhodoferax sp.]MDP2442036.1 type I secretion system permease/ATPase [Rhodoferax sp.]MDZ4206476.1 type I secretion system permease/ATPase [Rhodoferax sp.]